MITPETGRRPLVPLFSAATLLVVGFVITPQALAEIKGVTVKVDGLACPFCAYGLEKHLAGVPGVTKAETDLKAGQVNLTVTQKKHVTVVELQKAVQKAGFTLSAVTVTAIGSLIEEDGVLLLQTRESGQRFVLFEDVVGEKNSPTGKPGKLLTEKTEAALKALLKEKSLVSVTGPIHDHSEGDAGLRLQKCEAVP